MIAVDVENQLKEHYLLYKDMVFRISMIYVANIEDAKDITQEVFIRLMKHGFNFEDDNHEKKWLIRVTKNLCCDYHRSKWSKRESFDEIEKQYYQNDHESFETLEEIMKLSDKYKLIIILYYYEGYQIKEIAEMLNKKESTIKMRLKRAKEILKIEMELVV